MVAKLTILDPLAPATSALGLGSAYAWCAIPQDRAKKSAAERSIRENPEAQNRRGIRAMALMSSSLLFLFRTSRHESAIAALLVIFARQVGATKAKGPGHPDELREEPVDERVHRLIENAALGIELRLHVVEVQVRERDHETKLPHDAHELFDDPSSTPWTGGHAYQGHGLVDVLLEQHIEGHLQASRVAVVVLGGNDDQAVRADDRFPPLRVELLQALSLIVHGEDHASRIEELGLELRVGPGAVENQLGNILALATLADGSEQDWNEELPCESIVVHEALAA